MARKELTITISDEGRDEGKVFLIKEMSAAQLERWAMRVMLAMGRSGVDIPDDLMSQGTAGMLRLGAQALFSIDPDDAQPLLDEMMECVFVIPDPARPQVIRPLFDEDIEELSTRLQIRKEVIGLHINFSTPDSTLTSPSATTRAGGSSIKTSRAVSPP